jgi:hypothetical protein
MPTTFAFKLAKSVQDRRDRKPIPRGTVNAAARLPAGERCKTREHDRLDEEGAGRLCMSPGLPVAFGPHNRVSSRFWPRILGNVEPGPRLT